jgi:hypothetical protein
MSERERISVLTRIQEVSQSVLGDPSKGERIGIACSDINALMPVPCKNCNCWFGEQVLKILNEDAG